MRHAGRSASSGAAGAPVSFTPLGNSRPTSTPPCACWAWRVSTAAAMPPAGWGAWLPPKLLATAGMWDQGGVRRARWVATTVPTMLLCCRCYAAAWAAAAMAVLLLTRHHRAHGVAVVCYQGEGHHAAHADPAATKRERSHSVSECVQMGWDVGRSAQHPTGWQQDWLGACSWAGMHAACQAEGTVVHPAAQACQPAPTDPITSGAVEKFMALMRSAVEAAMKAMVRGRERWLAWLSTDSPMRALSKMSTSRVRDSSSSICTGVFVSAVTEAVVRDSGRSARAEAQQQRPGDRTGGATGCSSGSRAGSASPPAASRTAWSPGPGSAPGGACRCLACQSGGRCS